MLVVAALGGNALLRRGEALTAEAQRANVMRAADALARIVRAGHDLVVTHGNGPQIGLLAMQSDDWPLDILGAETDGMIGYLIERELENALDHDRPVATLLTQILVDPADPAFARPTKFVGPTWSEAEARARACPKGWTIAKDGTGWRRVVPSPRPVDIPDLRAVRLLLDHGAVVICGGGGGIPVARTPDGRLHGVEAVVDKDRSSALLAQRLEAQVLLLLTDVPCVMQGFGTPQAIGIPHLTPEEAEAMDLPDGSMGPKVQAAAAFARITGGVGVIGRLDDAADMLDGIAGTRIAAEPGA
ncbi:carbamate kinase [Jannaschia donghaensis]|uniref:Carbamate kinase n=1 Tax=Jannaschia donghaensis TaxID=420998 RepID=A0A0M6YLE9_9RHOB|nr:carbamate kinase [Jannaschia donghaensis]CTQ50343.1 Carbamate kinase 1 [Jannaschia donghaensis]